jgi:hypothetical protein
MRHELVKAIHFFYGGEQENKELTQRLSAQPLLGHVLCGKKKIK